MPPADPSIPSRGFAPLPRGIVVNIPQKYPLLLCSQMCNNLVGDYEKLRFSNARAMRLPCGGDFFSIRGSGGAGAQ
jgi:hypothetical protein